VQEPGQQPPVVKQPSHPQRLPFSCRSTVGDLRIARLDATASITSGGNVDPNRASRKATVRLRRESKFARTSAATAAASGHWPAYHGRHAGPCPAGTFDTGGGFSHHGDVSPGWHIVR
jgi:hypothetical protein